MRERTIPLTRPLDLRATLMVSGLKGPASRVHEGGLWRATRTPQGPASVRLAVGDGHLSAQAWGQGADHALDRLGDWVGEADDPDALIPHHPIVAEAARRGRGMRMASVGAVVELLVPIIIAQKVTGIAAGRSYRQLVARYGEPAPGPGPVRLPPPPDLLATLPYYEFHPLGVERKRADTIIEVCRRAARLEATLDGDLESAYRLLQAIRGVGPWTAACAMRIARGDADAVPVGDFHVPDIVAWSLAGEERGTDERMLELLEPYVGQRGRVVRLLERHGRTPPAYGPRLAPRQFRDH